jgi:hypothetical protein
MNKGTVPPVEEQPIAVEIQNEMLCVTLKDGRMISTPLVWYPWLMQATPEQQGHVELGIAGIHWIDLDEDLSVGGMLRGIRPPQSKLVSEINE